MTSQSLNGLHVDLVDIGPFFAVYLDADKMLIHDLRDRLILKRFALHYVAPMARGVANADQNGFVLSHGPLRCLSSPFIPIHRITGMLQQIRARRIYKA